MDEQPVNFDIINYIIILKMNDNYLDDTKPQHPQQLIYKKDHEDHPDQRYRFEEEDGYSYIINNMQGNWNGYVVLPESHRFTDNDMEECEVIVHGGLTYQTYEENRRIYGFDTLHWKDYKIYMTTLPCGENGESVNFNEDDSLFRTYDFVKNECLNLIMQFRNLE